MKIWQIKKHFSEFWTKVHRLKPQAKKSEKNHIPNAIMLSIEGQGGLLNVHVVDLWWDRLLLRLVTVYDQVNSFHLQPTIQDTQSSIPPRQIN